MLRGVKSGLGGHDAGASEVDEGVENASLQLSEWRRLALSESPTFSGFTDIFKKKLMFLALKTSPTSGIVDGGIQDDHTGVTTQQRHSV